MPERKGCVTTSSQNGVHTDTHFRIVECTIVCVAKAKAIRITGAEGSRARDINGYYKLTSDVPFNGRPLYQKVELKTWKEGGGM